MRIFLYRCPITGMTVQGTIAERQVDGRVYVPQSCPACGSIHLVNPLTGEGPPAKPVPRPKPRADK